MMSGSLGLEPPSRLLSAASSPRGPLRRGQAASSGDRDSEGQHRMNQAFC